MPENENIIPVETSRSPYHFKAIVKKMIVEEETVVRNVQPRKRCKEVVEDE
jgi:hypothetical protein